MPKVTPEASAQALAPPVVIRADGQPTLQESSAEVRAVQAEGRARLLKHHINQLGALGEFTTADNAVSLLIDGPATFKAMFADLERARRSIQVESYIFEDAELGQRMAEVLKRKASAGLDVRLIYDAVGSLTTPRAFFDELAQAGVRVCEFNPVRTSFPFRADKLNHRDHRKITLVDGKVAYTGGINVSDVYSAGSSSILKRKSDNDDEEPKRGWRDTSVRVEGPAVTDFSILYADTWMRQGCEHAPVPAARRASVNGERLVTVIGSTPGDAEPRIYRALLTAIGSARQSVHMTMSYFVPDPQTTDFLIAAARRGVEVVLVLQGKSDSELVLRAGQSYYHALLEAGVTIYERSDTLLHAKTAVIDRVWSTIGSSNVDWRSFLHNDEVNVIVFGAEFAAEMEALFRDDLAQAEAITVERWQQRGVWRRVQERFGRLFEYWL
ncbi:MAG TPA: phospholipase D-like domain-containing protein [Rhodocyclaceae bacterium]|nr:phospholipase D-like domain-containing protein [Rhodocyclaceae bacterium]